MLQNFHNFAKNPKNSIDNRIFYAKIQVRCVIVAVWFRHLTMEVMYVLFLE